MASIDVKEQKDVMPVRYSYGIASALLAGGAAISLITGHPAGAQVAQNDASQVRSIVPLAGAPESFADLTEQLAPAVVNISTRQRITVNAGNPFAGTPFADLFGDRGGQPTTREAQSLGSGFIISADGYVVTNNHVITAEGRGEVEAITVTMPDGTEYPAELVGRDAASDLAVLKIENGSEPFPFVNFNETGDARAGDWVIAIGNPFGLGGTVTSGIISAVLRTTSGGAYDRYIQTDASINRGNSGGPLFDMQGNVIGINNAIFSPSGGSVGIGFAIPADIASPIVQKLIAGEEIERGYLGVRIGPVNDDIAEALGLSDKSGEFIQSVEPGEAADQAGLRPGDIVTKVNSRDVTQEETLSYLIANIEPGTRVPLEVYRDGQRRTVNVTVGKRPSEEELLERYDAEQPEGDQPGAAPSEGGVIEEALGLQVQEITPRIARQLGADPDAKGVVVALVDPTSGAAQRGIQRGDILLSANYATLETVADLEAAIAEARSQGREAILLRIQRRGRPATYLPVPLRTQ